MNDFASYMGNNHNFVPSPGRRRGGAVSFSRHLGHPLSDRLWEDLVERLGCVRLRVYRHDQSEWTDGELGRAARVYLDPDGNVQDIHFTP